ncbi:MAG: hypothetical protein AAB088_02340, partial [Actinomycetota bacterium]
TLASDEQFTHRLAAFNLGTPQSMIVRLGSPGSIDTANSLLWARGATTVLRSTALSTTTRKLPSAGRLSGAR